VEDITVNVQTPETIQVSRAQFERAEAMANIYRNTGIAGLLAAMAGGLSCDPYAANYRAYAHRDAARAFSGQPDVGDVHIDAPLTNISIAYRNAGYIGGQVFPRVPVKKQSDKFFVFDIGPAFNDVAQVRAPAGRAAGGGYTLSTDNYSVVEKAIETPVPDELRENADNPLNPDRNATAFVSDKIDLAVERDVATLAFTQANWSNYTTLAGTDQWSDLDDSHPMVNVSTARLAVLGACGLLPNTAVMGIQVFEKLMQNDDILERCKYGGSSERPAMVTAEMIAQLFMVQRVLVGTAMYNTAYEGRAASLSYVWGKYCWIGYVAPQPAIETPSAGYVFTTGRRVDRYREDAVKSDFIRAAEAWDAKKTAAGAGYLISGAVA
jgi:hypothetical protein